MSIPAVHCEARKTSYRQTKDGLVVSFVIHPNDMPDALAVAPLGQRYMLALAQIGDDEQPIDPRGGPEPEAIVRAAQGSPRPVPVEPDGGGRTVGSIPATGAKERRPWETLSPQQQAGILCCDKGFQKYVSELTSSGWVADEQSAAVWLREELGILSRRDLEGRPDLAAKLNKIRAEFMEWAGRVPVGAR